MSERARWAYSVSSPILRRYALTMTRRIAERYRDHLALALWHIDNELGCHVPYDYSDDSAAGSKPGTGPSPRSTPHSELLLPGTGVPPEIMCPPNRDNSQGRVVSVFAALARESASASWRCKGRNRS
ncbi:beta-galactosidase [Streptosporangium lutulentum]|uniref:Glycoside hydrolase family 42 N-terminal domain-containing protein n=1 Tax=Streptosporangium lutulentum TaxID=1461250 RepID=A0ABT9QA82_9ACTN|nr:beta-galactosidase [Streptosporangium lutulentum]MDP9843677.1 hypothetical protein [Streptosporangium lutulentum]